MRKLNQDKKKELLNAIETQLQLSYSQLGFKVNVDMPFRYSKLRNGLLTCLLIQLGIHSAAYAQDTNVFIAENNVYVEDTHQNNSKFSQIEQSVANSRENYDEDTEEALIALKLKQAVEQGLIEPSVLEDYQRETINKQSNGQFDSMKESNNQYLNDIESSTDDSVVNAIYDSEEVPDNASNLGETTQSTSSNNSGLNDTSVNSVNNSSNDVFDLIFSDDSYDQPTSSQEMNRLNDQIVETPLELDRTLATVTPKVSTEFNAPVARLDSTQPPIGFDERVEQQTLLNPSNRETLGLSDSQNGEMGSNGNTLLNSTEQNELSQSKADSIDANNENFNQNEGINPDDYLPDYEADVNNNPIDEEIVVEEEAVDANPGLLKGLYNRLFNDGYAGLPKINADIYIEESSGTQSNNTNQLTKINDSDQPYANIKAAMENITVESISDFTAVTPKLYEEAINAAQAVGYYDIDLRFQKVSSSRIAVIIESLGDPVTVSSRIIDIRGEGKDLEEFQEIMENIPPDIDETFNHGVYKQAKAAIETTKEQYGFFDGQWLNRSVDVILPDNTADVDLIYDTGERYHFDEVVFFTIDPETGQLTTDPDKLPVKAELLHQLHEFQAGDQFYAPSVTEFTNDLSATRYFNVVNVETVRPGNSRGSLGFENDPRQNSVDESEINGSNNQDTNSQLNASESSLSGNSNLSNHSYENINQSLFTEDEPLQNDNVIADAIASDDYERELSPVEYSIDQETSEKLAEITAKAERLSRLPDDRVLNETEEEAKTLLGKISNAISNAAEKILPDEKDPFSTTDSLPDDLSEITLANRKTPQQVSETKSVPLYVFVTADKPKDVDLGIGYGTDTGVRAVARLDHNLVNRDGYQAGINVGASRINKSIDIHASRPWNHPLDDTLNGSVSYEQETIDQGEGNLDLSTSTVKAGLARNIRSDTGWNRTYSVKYRLDELESGVSDTDRENLPVPFNRDNSKFEQEALLLGYQMDKTTTDNVINPTKGFHQYYSLEAGSDSVLTDTDLAIARAGVSGVYSFGEQNKHQVVASLDGGYIWANDFEDVPYKLRFFAGGDRSIRGYDYNSLSALEKGYLVGGQVLAVGSAEYNYEFRPNIRGAVFADFGNAYDTDFEAETKLGVGVGVRWASPVGMVRLDLAAGVLEESIPVRLHFFIGSPLQ